MYFDSKYTGQQLEELFDKTNNVVLVQVNVADEGDEELKNIKIGNTIYNVPNGTNLYLHTITIGTGETAYQIISTKADKYNSVYDAFNDYNNYVSSEYVTMGNRQRIIGISNYSLAGYKQIYFYNNTEGTMTFLLVGGNYYTYVVKKLG